MVLDQLFRGQTKELWLRIGGMKGETIAKRVKVVFRVEQGEE